MSGHIAMKRPSSPSPAKSGSAKVPRGPLLLEVGEDPHTPEEHRNLDSKCMSWFKMVHWDPDCLKRSEPDYVSLNSMILQKILQGSKCHIDPQIKETPLDDSPKCAEYLAGEHGDALRALLLESYNKKDFSKLRCLKLFQIPSQGMSAVITDGQSKATKIAWKKPFIGTSHQTLLDSIKEMNRDRSKESSYSNYLAIIQSSGTGKSRTVDELAKLIFTIPFNVRTGTPSMVMKDDEDGGFPYPFADHQVHDYLVKTEFQSSYECTIAAFLIFFQHLFNKINDTLTTNEATILDALKKPDSSATLATWWRDALEEVTDGQSFRECLYGDTLKDCKQLPSGKDFEDDPGLLNMRSSKTKLAGEELIRTIDRIESKAGATIDDGSLRIIVYFDEAHTLTNAVVHIKDAPSRTRYQALCSAINHLRDLPLFAITLSTNSKLSAFSPPKKAHPSSRVQDVKEDPLQAPYTELMFDCLTDGRPFLRPGELTLEQVCETQFICKFGRPLWHAMYNAGPDEAKTGLIDIAMSKLAGSSDPTTFNLSYPYNNGIVAALSTRLLVDFEPSREIARQFEAQLVEGHMRIAYSIPKHREYFRSGYPSEPVLAEAAARIVHEHRLPMAVVLEHYIRQGLMSKGERGELVMRLLLIEAFDKATRKRYPNSAPMAFNHPIHLFNFLEALFGSEHLLRIKKTIPDNRPEGVAFEKAFEDAYVHFTHFGKNENESISNTHGAWAALVRGMAIQCSTNQDGIDCIIPVTFGVDSKLSERTVTGILIQVKNREKRQTIVIDEKSLNRKRGFFPKRPIAEDDRPYIAIAMQFGVTLTEWKRNFSVTRKPYSSPSDFVHGPEIPGRNALPDIAEAPAVVQAQGQSHPGVASQGTQLPTGRGKGRGHPRYAITVIGCTPSVYASMEDERKPMNARDVYAFLLGGRGLYDEHPRQSEANLSYLRRFKPGWRRGKDYFDWTGSKFLCGEGDDDLMQFSQRSQDSDGDAQMVDAQEDTSAILLGEEAVEPMLEPDDDRPQDDSQDIDAPSQVALQGLGLMNMAGPSQ
ncbi:uncharacterized protein LAESUDRAFT_684107 [Laetiporus sulphureus 93-53]|uniref:Uncharacterized protein n=1 Tax=Laetiporus sulphureus 93-53 TaxID=1314785 RepID=A0A165CRG9_9APHY|nr:uncharacterized protein LAESUDRAFT_684107 [Laetiporus sulphureus 93-53]KZT03296.1 hypothetical protein LAESUDRAFT_684107 [Laetiporus sulphureus 93-53]